VSREIGGRRETASSAISQPKSLTLRFATLPSLNAIAHPPPAGKGEREGAPVFHPAELHRQSRGEVFSFIYLLGGVAGGGALQLVPQLVRARLHVFRERAQLRLVERVGALPYSPRPMSAGTFAETWVI
jgi:hypothetical protein